MPVSFTDINIWAVLVSAVIIFLLGGVWYTALFGKLRLEMHGYTPEREKAMQAKRPPALFFGGMIACYLVVSLVLAALFTSFGVSTAGGGAFVGFLLWLAMTAGLGMTGHLASDLPIGAYLIDAAFQLVFLVMAGAILGAWQ